MRARHRHFNARDAAAGAVFDARFIQGISDNTTISTWPDRSRNGWDATQSTNPPTYRSSTLNGSACVVFNGNSGRQLNFAAANGYFRNKTAGYMLAIFRSTSTSGAINQSALIWSTPSSDNTTRLAIQPKRSSTQQYWVAARRLDADAQVIANNTTSSTTHNIAEGIANWGEGTASIVVNGSAATSVNFAASGNTSNTDSANTSIGTSTAAGGFIGEVALAQAFDSIPSDAAKKRLRHAAAFSFKLACN
jgi:hypothetical protein